MKLAKENPEILDCAGSRNLGIDAAYALLIAPEEVNAEVQEKLALGDAVTQKDTSSVT